MDVELGQQVHLSNRKKLAHSLSAINILLNVLTHL